MIFLSGFLFYYYFFIYYFWSLGSVLSVEGDERTGPYKANRKDAPPLRHSLIITAFLRAKQTREQKRCPQLHSLAWWKMSDDDDDCAITSSHATIGLQKKLSKKWKWLNLEKWKPRGNIFDQVDTPAGSTSRHVTSESVFFLKPWYMGHFQFDKSFDDWADLWLVTREGENLNPHPSNTSWCKDRSRK